MANAGGLNWLIKWLMGAGGTDEAPAPMTPDAALSYAPVWSCVSKITGAFMVMDLELLRRRNNGREVQASNPKHSLMNRRTNTYQNACQFKRTAMAQALLWGNHRSYIVTHNGRTVPEGGIPIELIPLPPDRTRSKMINGQKWHGTIIDEDQPLAGIFELGDKSEKTIYFSDEEIWHLPGLGYDGVEGVSLLELASRTWNNGIGDEVYQRSQQKKGYAGGAMLEAPAGVFRDAKDAQEFLEKFREQHEGAEKAGKIGLLREGIKLNVQSMSNRDAEFVERRRLNREDVALQFCLEGILGDSTNASYNSLYEKNLAYRVNCLSPWTVAIEQECDAKLLTESERNRGYAFRFDDRTLLRMDANSLMTFCSQAIASRILNSNECRELLDYNPREGGDVYENPAVDTRSGGADNQPNDPIPPAENRALRTMFAKLVSVECKRVTAAAASPDKFLAWCEKWYASWEPKLADSIEEVGGDRQLATDHCEESRRRLLTASEVSPGDLATSVARCVESWPNRVNQLVEGVQLCLK